MTSLLEEYRDDFILVTYRNKRKKPKLQQLKHTICRNSSYEIDPEVAIRRIEKAKNELITSDIFHSAIASLREALDILENRKITEIYSIGLGRIGECLIARYQLAFLLALKDIYKVHVKVYDPIFTDKDCVIFKHFNCDVLDENKEGKYRVDNNRTTLFYLPHCPKQLTNNLLWANWGLNLNSCVIIANSFNTIVDSHTNTDLENFAENIRNITPYTVELPVINTFKYYEIFNDTAIHIFPINKLCLIPDDFWESNPAPEYEHIDLEFITQSIDETA